MLPSASKSLRLAEPDHQLKRQMRCPNEPDETLWPVLIYSILPDPSSRFALFPSLGTRGAPVPDVLLHGSFVITARNRLY